MSAALQRGWRKGARTIAQVIAGGALTALVTAIVGGMPPATQGLVMGAWVALVAFVQNWAETAGTIPTLLPSSGVVVGPASGAVATVEAVADETGDIVGDVLDTAGDVVGAVTGQIPDKDDERGGAGFVALFVVIFLVLLMVGGFAVCDLMFDDESEPGDNHLLGRVELVSHDYDDGGYYDEEEGGYYEEGDRYGGYGSDYGGNRRDDRNRNRGAFSPGPFDRSPIDFSYSCISLDCSGRDKKQDERDPR